MLKICSHQLATLGRYVSDGWAHPWSPAWSPGQFSASLVVLKLMVFGRIRNFKPKSSSRNSSEETIQMADTSRWQTISQVSRRFRSGDLWKCSDSRLLTVILNGRRHLLLDGLLWKMFTLAGYTQLNPLYIPVSLQRSICISHSLHIWLRFSRQPGLASPEAKNWSLYTVDYLLGHTVGYRFYHKVDSIEYRVEAGYTAWTG